MNIWEKEEPKYFDIYWLKTVSGLLLRPDG
jgi:hypothetical protein